MISTKSVWLIGSGGMATAYAEVLTAMGVVPRVVGRGETSARAFTEKVRLPVDLGGLDVVLATQSERPEAAIVAVGVEALASTVRSLLLAGVRRILVEKPGALDYSGIADLASLTASTGAQVLIAYNRRFYAATLRAQEMIVADGGVQSMHFEFTEWSHQIAPLHKGNGVKRAWFLANSTHVVDLAFHLGGSPKEMTAYTDGALSWHPSSSVFSGAGRTDRGAMFTYQANWDAPGRWGLEVITSNQRLIFRPMEILQIMRKGSVQIESVSLDDELDREFKPGLYQQVRRFLCNDVEGFCTVGEQVAAWPAYCRIAGYDVNHGRRPAS